VNAVPDSVPTTDLDALLLSIAKRHTCFETLETRNSDSLDFHEVSAEGLRQALVAAYEAGRAAGSEGADSDERLETRPTASRDAAWDPRQAAGAIAARQSEYALVMEQAAETARQLDERLHQLATRAKAALLAGGVEKVDAFLDECRKVKLDTGRLDASFVDLLERHGATAYPPPYRPARSRWAIVPVE